MMEIDWDANLYSEALGCVTLDKLLDLSEPLFFPICIKGITRIPTPGGYEDEMR